ncbi:MAG: hypothetical protein K1X51_04775 [Rhodospirillaceae bacterium]|nr:hypothetical protein [Rhodospirillaceae bacterium]
MRNPSSANRGRLSPQRTSRAATFRFGEREGFRPPCRLAHAKAVIVLLAAMHDRVANGNTDKRNDAWAHPGRTLNTRAGISRPARRTAEKRPPAHGEMEHVHDIYGGIFADGTHPGSA